MRSCAGSLTGTFQSGCRLARQLAGRGIQARGPAVTLVPAGRSSPVCRYQGAEISVPTAYQEVTLTRGSDTSVVVQDDLDDLLQVVLDLGRRPEARFQGIPAGEYLREEEVTADDLESAIAAVGDFGCDNRAGVQGTLHRISAIRNRRGAVIGLTCRVGRAVTGHTDMLKDLVESGHSVLLLGRPGVGKTTVIRELCRVLADEQRKRVVIVDTSNEIGGDGDVPHPAIGGARRMQVADATKQHHVMIEAVENHMPQVVVVDEIGTEAEALACRTIAERGVQLMGTAHGCMLENLIKNPTLADLIGGVQSVTLGDEEAMRRGTQKTILERKAPPTFPIVVEIRARSFYVAHWAEESVDALLLGKAPTVQVRERDTAASNGLRVTEMPYHQVPDPEGTVDAAANSWDEDYEAALRDMHGASGSPSDSWAWAQRIKARGQDTDTPRSAFTIASRAASSPAASSAKKAPKKARK